MTSQQEVLPRASKMGRAELTGWVVGGLLLALYFGIRLYLAQAHDDSIERFDTTRQAALEAAEHQAEADRLALLGTFAQSAPDMAGWSRGRVEAFHSATLDAPTASPQAVLRIEAVNMEVPIYRGTSEFNLNRGAGLIEGTSTPGAGGNMGLAAHRDGYFRALQGVKVGDRLSVQTLTADYRYVVTSISIVAPDAVEVLDATAMPSLTLVTCYPFYFVGSAPKRFIVRAELDHSSLQLRAEISR